MSHPSARPLDPPLRATLHAELREAAKDLALRPLLQREPHLLPRFARYHEYLTHLPRRTRRALQRQWKRSLAAIALLLALGQAPALAAAINVTINTPDINPDGQCSLIEAIENANDTATATSMATARWVTPLGPTPSTSWPGAPIP
jgi:hypothetical protein